MCVYMCLRVQVGPFFSTMLHLVALASFLQLGSAADDWGRFIDHPPKANCVPGLCLDSRTGTVKTYIKYGSDGKISALGGAFPEWSLSLFLSLCVFSFSFLPPFPSFLGCLYLHKPTFVCVPGRALVPG